MDDGAMKVRPIGNGIAIEVLGLKLWEPIAEHVLASLADLWSKSE